MVEELNEYLDPKSGEELKALVLHFESYSLSHRLMLVVVNHRLQTQKWLAAILEKQ
jgi:hypothetical protein